MVVRPSTVKIFGHGIEAGDYLHLISDKHKPVRFTTWSDRSGQGRINIGHYCLISPGVDITAARHIDIGDNTMLGADCVIHDCDWHGLYNRLRPFRCTAPVVLKNNVWVGMRCLIFKGVTIGENSVIGAGSVVTHDIPDNVVAAGNPAKVVKQLNPARRMLKREYLFRRGAQYWQQQALLEHYLSAENTTRHWLSTLWQPNHDD